MCLCVPRCFAAEQWSVRSECSPGWSWTRPAASSYLRSASRSELEDFTCCTACTGVRRLRPRSRSETRPVLFQQLNRGLLESRVFVFVAADPSGPEGLGEREEVWERRRRRSAPGRRLYPAAAHVTESFLLHCHADTGEPHWFCPSLNPHTSAEI